MAYIRKVADGYRIRWREPIRDENGRPTGAFKQKQETYSDEGQANERLNEIRTQLSYGSVDPSTAKAARDRTLTDYAQDYFDSLQGSLKSRTVDGYRDLYRVHVQPTLGNRPVGTLTVSDVTKLRAQLLTSTPTGRKTTRHPKTARQVIGVLKRVLDTAKDNGGIQTNPAADVKVRPQQSANTAKFTHTPLQPEQIAALANYVATKQHSPTYALALTFAAYTGLRAAELAGLEISDLTLSEIPGTAGAVRVVRTKTKKAGVWTTATTKTNEIRTVPLEAWLADDLRDYLANTHQNAGDAAAPLFVGHDGRSPIDTHNIYQRYMQPALAACKLPNARFHDLRHSFAVNLLSSNVDFKRVSKWLGHKTLSLTLDTYGDYINPDVLQPAGLARPVAATVEATGNVVLLENRRQA